MLDYREDFQKMCDQWDKAQRDGIFGKVPAKVDYSPSDYYGMTQQMAAVAAGSEKINDADYWNAIFRLSRGEQVAESPGATLSEADALLDFKGDSGSARGWTSKSPNPVPIWTKGKDQKYQPSRWFDNDDIGKLVRMKEDLHALGDKLSTRDGKEQVPSTKSEAIMKKIRRLQAEVDRLSDHLTCPLEEQEQR